MSKKTSTRKATPKAKPKTNSTKSKTKTKTKTKSKEKPKITKSTKKTTTRKVKTKTAPKKALKTKKKKRKATPLPKTATKKSRPRRLPLEKPVKGVLMNYQRGTIRQKSHYGLIKLEGVTTIAAAASYIGRSVILHFNENKQITGRIISVHGRNGVLRARFRRGLAGEAIAKGVVVL
ncbi:MAG: 50S ribosomal protein L35ae [Candidatus Thorarchaeota archaeon]